LNIFREFWIAKMDRTNRIVIEREPEPGSFEESERLSVDENPDRFEWFE
jgi:hypothetical protein